MLTYCIVAALGLVLIFEGFLPFLTPRVWRSMLELALKRTDKELRIVGLTLMVSGLLILIFAHYLL